MLQNLYLFASSFLAFFIKGITGFGNTLVLGSLFSFAVPNRITTPVDLLFSIPTNLFVVWRERKNVSLKVVVPLSLMLLAGIIPGTLLLKTGDDWVLRASMGLVITGLAVEMLLRKPPHAEAKKANPLFLVSIGVLSGVLAGMFGIGALLISYISRSAENKSQFRANICCVFLVDNLFRLFLYWYTGLLTKEVLLTALCLSPAVALGMLAGIKADRRMNEKAVKNTVILLLLVSGITLVIKSTLFR